MPVVADLDPDDVRPLSVQIAAALRAAISTGDYAPGDKLPSQHELAAQYGVARMTIQQALRMLREERLTVSRQGSGVYVRECPPGAQDLAVEVRLRPVVEVQAETLRQAAQALPSLGDETTTQAYITWLFKRAMEIEQEDR